jgi:hypothetical protein
MREDTSHFNLNFAICSLQFALIFLSLAYASGWNSALLRVAAKRLS